MTIQKHDFWTVGVK